jgi:hypothetical protein
MKSKSKIWLGVGAFVVVGTGAVGAGGVLPTPAPGERGSPAALPTDTAIPRLPTGAFMLAQHEGHAPAPAPAPDAGEGGETQRIANLPPELALAVRVALLRGHLGVGDELVRQKQWNAALPHFLHPIEELYADIKDPLAEMNVPTFEDALKALADVVKAKKGGADYARALKAVTGPVVAADAALKTKQADWPGFIAEAAIESIKAAGSEYENAVVDGKLAKPVEYQDARGFIWQADRMIESVAVELQKKDASSLKQVRAGFAELKKVFPAAMPPRRPVKDHAQLLAIISRIELAAGKLM